MLILSKLTSHIICENLIPLPFICYWTFSSRPVVNPITQVIIDFEEGSQLFDIFISQTVIS